MNRKQKIIRNTILLIGFSFLLFTRSYLYLDPLAAHRASERSIHYGPSEVLHVEDFSRGKYVLGKYDQWISCNVVIRSNRLFWRFGGTVTGFEVDKEKPLFYLAQYSQPEARAFGVINDQRIEKVEVHLTDRTVLSQSSFYEDMFLLHWESDAEFRKIMAYDASGAVIFEEERLR